MILVECNPDEYLLRALGIPGSMIRHEDGKGEILQKLKKGKAEIALIDQDPGRPQPRELSNYRCIEDNAHTSILEHHCGDKTVIMVKPRLEEWILNRAKANSIDPARYGIPRDADNLHRIIHVERQRSFRAFIECMVDVDPEFLRINKWILRRS